MGKQYKLIIFDFDKTLYDGRFYAFYIMLYNVCHLWRTRAERVVRKQLAGLDMGTGAKMRSEEMTRLSAMMNIEQETADKWYSTYLNSMEAILKRHYTARPGAWNAIEELLDAGVEVGVLSDYPNTGRRLKAINLTDERIHQWSAEEMGALKPNARPFIEAAKEVGVAPEQTLVIGDRADTDGKGAKAANMDSLLIKGKKAKEGCGFDVATWDDIVLKLKEIAQSNKEQRE